MLQQKHLKLKLVNVESLWIKKKNELNKPRRFKDEKQDVFCAVLSQFNLLVDFYNEPQQVQTLSR